LTDSQKVRMEQNRKSALEKLKKKGNTVTLKTPMGMSKETLRENIAVRNVNGKTIVCTNFPTGKVKGLKFR
jgi:hypothetical protein